MHLVCRNLHQIANLHVNPKVKLQFAKPEKDLERLVQSSRIFEELRIGEGFNEYMNVQERFKVIEEYLGFIGPHIKRLEIIFLKPDLKILQKLLNLLPNLESLWLIVASIVASENLKLNFKSTKIERFELESYPSIIENVSDSLKNCAIKELKLDSKAWSQKESEAVRKLLISQEKNLKKLVSSNCNFGFLVNLKDLRLEHLDLKYDCSDQRNSLEFLKHQLNLKYLKLTECNVNNEAWKRICGLKHLETLDIDGSVFPYDLSDLRNLAKLKRLRLTKKVTYNILDHRIFGLFNDLEELDACFEDASVESVQEMKRITPNLRKIRTENASSQTINAMLESFESLEAVEIWRDNWEISAGKIHPNIKHIFIFRNFKLRAEQFTQQFPNLEYLEAWCCPTELTESFFVKLLSGLKQLKTLKLYIKGKSKLDPDSVLQCFEKYGNHLEAAKIDFDNLKFKILKKPGNPFCIYKTN